jgi:hypothetical protein
MEDNMRIDFYTSDAGVAGDPDKLLIGITEDGREYSEMYNTMSLFGWSRKKAMKKIINQIRQDVTYIALKKLGR